MKTTNPLNDRRHYLATVLWRIRKDRLQRKKLNISPEVKEAAKKAGIIIRTELWGKYLN